MATPKSSKPAVGIPAKRTPFKKDSPALEKKEERLHKDLDHDGERGESPAHAKKVLGGGGGGKPFLPAPKPGKFGPKEKPEKAGKAAPFGGKQAKPFGAK